MYTYMQTFYICIILHIIMAMNWKSTCKHMLKYIYLIIVAALDLAYFMT